MKKRLDEVKRLQRIAGLLKEDYSEGYVEEAEANPDTEQNTQIPFLGDRSPSWGDIYKKISEMFGEDAAKKVSTKWGNHLQMAKVPQWRLDASLDAVMLLVDIKKELEQGGEDFVTVQGDSFEDDEKKKLAWQHLTEFGDSSQLAEKYILPAMGLATEEGLRYEETVFVKA